MPRKFHTRRGEGRERAASARSLITANGTSQATEVAALQIDHFMENIQPYVLPATPNVLSIGRRCRHDGYGLFWEPFAKVPKVFAPDGSEIPVEVFGDIPYFRDHVNLALREEHRGEDALPAAPSEGPLPRGTPKKRDAKSSPVAPSVDDPVENEEQEVADDPNLKEMIGSQGGEDVAGEPAPSFRDVHANNNDSKHTQHSHLFTHASMCRDCDVCVKARATRRRHVHGKLDLGVQPTRFGQQVTGDSLIDRHGVNEEDPMFPGSMHVFVM